MKMWDIEGLPLEELEVFVGLKTRISLEGVEGTTVLVATGFLEAVTWAELGGENGASRSQFFFKGRANDPLILDLPTEGVTAKIGSQALEPRLTAADL